MTRIPYTRVEESAEHNYQAKESIDASAKDVSIAIASVAAGEKIGKLNRLCSESESLDLVRLRIHHLCQEGITNATEIDSPGLAFCRFNRSRSPSLSSMYL